MAAKDDPQVNVRVSPEVFEILEAAIYAKRLRGMQELLRPEIDRIAQRLREEPGVQTAARGRKEQDAHQAGTLKRLPQREQADKSSE